MTARPQDHLPKKVIDATNAQAANVAQKAIIDNVVVKFTRILALVHGSIMRTDSKSYERMTKAELIAVVTRQDEAIIGIQDTLRMDRHAVQAIRLEREHTFPDERVQAILTEAVDKITDAILSDVV